MLIATWSEAAQGLALVVLAYGALAAVFVVLGRFAHDNWRRREVPQTVLARLGQLVVCGVAVAGLPIVAVIAVAIGCPPDAYECPA
jgi:orotate phosphoribosyltransferase